MNQPEQPPVLIIGAGKIARGYVGHLVALDDKRRAIAQVFSQLRPGGRFVFDDFLMTPLLIFIGISPAVAVASVAERWRKRRRLSG